MRVPVAGVMPWWQLVIGPVLAVAIVAFIRTRSSSDDDARWLIVARDSGYTVAVDTSRVRRGRGGAIRIWYRTDHSAMRFYNEKAFDREVVEAILQCGNYTFRIVTSEMSVRGGRMVVRQTTDDGELGRQPWRHVEAGSTDADVARAACEIAKKVRLR